MSGIRIARLNEQFRRELAELLLREVRDPRVAGVTVTGVEVSADLSYAKVFVRVPPDPVAAAEVMAGLQAAAPFLRRSLGRGLHVRKVPELRFVPDETLERAQRIERILSDVLPDVAAEADAAQGPAPAPGDASPDDGSGATEGE